MQGQTLPLVSVIIPCFNHEQYVRQCIISVLQQTYLNIELIVLDDGSTDQSPNIVRELSKERGFYFEAHPNMGLPTTLNKGLQRAQGKYIVILASDDLMMLDRVEKQVTFLESRPDVGVCAGNFLSINADNYLRAKQKIRPEMELDFYDIFLDRKPGPPAPTAMMRREAIDEVGGYDPNIMVEDLYMWLKLTKLGYKIVILNDVLGYYRCHEFNSHFNYRKVIDSVMKIYEEYRDDPKYSLVVNRFFLSMFVKMSSRDKTLAIELLKKISWYLPSSKLIRGIMRLAFKW